MPELFALTGIINSFTSQGLNVYPDKTVYPLGIENKVLAMNGIKEAIIVSGKDVQNNEFEKPYLFVILEDNVDETKIMEELKIHIEQVLSEEERPADIFVIDKKPISRFKTDRQYLRDTYGL